jgi:ribosome biogenesis GTPase A
MCNFALYFRLEEDEHLVLTPFEKNLEVWRQLWRVLERSDVIVQVRPRLRSCKLQAAFT